MTHIPSNHKQAIAERFKIESGRSVDPLDPPGRPDDNGASLRAHIARLSSVMGNCKHQRDWELEKRVRSCDDVVRSRVSNAVRKFMRVYGREPTVDEVVRYAGVTVQQARKWAGQ